MEDRGPMGAFEGYGEHDPMLTPLEAAPMREDVTQADREAAADEILHRGLPRSLAASIRRGENDAHHSVQAFARHRLAHTARPDAGSEVERVARLEAIRDVVRTAFFACDDSEDCGDDDIRIPRKQFDELSAALDRIEKLMPDTVQPALPAVLVSLVMEDLAAMREGVDRGMVEVPADIAEHVLSLGRVEWGQTHAHDAEGHGEHVARSVRLTAETFGQTEDQHMHGLWLEGTETVLCHTGTSPNAPKTTQALVGAWNWLVDNAAALSRKGG